MSEIYCEAEELVKLLEETDDLNLQIEVSKLIFNNYNINFDGEDTDVSIIVKLYDINKNYFKCDYISNYFDDDYITCYHKNERYVYNSTVKSITKYEGMYCIIPYNTSFYFYIDKKIYDIILNL
jgi:hypothetical protein